MTVTRLLVRGAVLRPGDFTLPPDVARHARVTRVGAGEPVELLNLEGAVALARVVRWQGAACTVEVESVLQERGEPPFPLVLGLGVLHTQAFDWAVEKATELGATSIVPVLSARVQGRRHEARVERWQRIADAAVTQCGRVRAPRLQAPESLEAFVNRPAGLKLLADPESCDSLDGAGSGASIAVLVGPEGGLLEDEVALARASGYTGLRLGPRILRAETAAVAALTLAQHLAGWLRP